RQKILDIYGLDNPMKSDKVKFKQEQTCLEKYGYKNVMHNPEIAERACAMAYKTKDYRFPSGRIDKVQGYEPFALNDLQSKECVHENDIITSRTQVPEIWYLYNGTYHRYYVDIYIPNQNRCIERSEERRVGKE